MNNNYRFDYYYKNKFFHCWYWGKKESKTCNQFTTYLRRKSKNRLRITYLSGLLKQYNIIYSN